MQKLCPKKKIYLGENVWKPEFDPEFDAESVKISKQLKDEYKRVAAERNIAFLAASDYVCCSEVDNEHLDEDGHRILSEVICAQIKKLF